MLRSNSQELSNMDITKNSKLLNAAYSKVHPFTELPSILRSVVAYSRTFHEDYSMTFWEFRIRDILKDLKYANFVPFPSPSTYYRYISVTRLYMYKEYLILFVEELNKRKQLTENKNCNCVGSVHLGAPVEFDSNTGTSSLCGGYAFVLYAIVNFAVSTLQTLNYFHHRARERFEDVNEMLDIDLEVNFECTQIVGDIHMNQVPLVEKRPQLNSVELGYSFPRIQQG